MYCQLNNCVQWSEKNWALSLIIDVRSRPGRQRTICLKTGKATNRSNTKPSQSAFVIKLLTACIASIQYS